MKKLLFVLLIGLVANVCNAADQMLPRVYRGRTPVKGWLMSEKLDGVRGYWDGRQLWSKHAVLLRPPQAFMAGLPPFAVEGELWGGRGRFAETSGIVRRQQPDSHWLGLKFAIFDVPQAGGTFSERIGKAQDWFEAHPSPYAFVIRQRPIHSREQLKIELKRVEELGGEGLILRAPEALYRNGRSPQILKFKSYQDAEARVVAHLPGKGRNRGRLGALLVETDKGLRFKIGSGFSDAERESPPPLGAIITYKFYGTYKSNLPRFPTYLRVRSDQGL